MITLCNQIKHNPVNNNIKEQVKQIIDDELFADIVAKNTLTKFNDMHYLFCLSLILDFDLNRIQSLT